jgi:hypothetical protein
MKNKIFLKDDVHEIVKVYKGSHFPIHNIKPYLYLPI